MATGLTAGGESMVPARIVVEDATVVTVKSTEYCTRVCEPRMCE
jgi:hypothetical protein